MVAQVSKPAWINEGPPAEVTAELEHIAEKIEARKESARHAVTMADKVAEYNDVRYYEKRMRKLLDRWA